MKKVFCILGILTILVAIFYFISRYSQSNLKDRIKHKIQTHILISEGKIIDQLCDTWINKAFIKVLKETKSFRKTTERIKEISFFSITKVGDQYDVSGDGWGARNVNRCIDGSFKHLRINENNNYYFEFLKREPSEVKDTYTIEIEPELKSDFDSFILCTPDLQKIILKRLNENTKRILRSTVLSGQYMDKEGKIYIFNDDGTAIWPSQTFKYEITITDDYFTVGENEKYYIFEWNDKVLNLYAANYDDSGTFYKVNNNPTIVLTKKE